MSVKISNRFVKRKHNSNKLFPALTINLIQLRPSTDSDMIHSLKVALHSKQDVNK